MSCICKPLNIGVTRAIVLLFIVFFSAATMAQTVFSINSLGDDGAANAGDGICATGNPWGANGFLNECTLRAAIEEANAVSGSVTIEVSAGIASDGFGRSIIDVTSPLPIITDTLTIAGETHPDFDGAPFTNLIIRADLGGGAFSSGLTIEDAPGSVIRHIAVLGFPSHGIRLSGGNSYTISDSMIGGYWVSGLTSVDGNGGSGIVISNASSPGSNAFINNNIVLGNDKSGVLIGLGTEAAVLQGNIIGLRPGLFAHNNFEPTDGNGDHGVFITSTAGSGNQIGFFAGNTISNNGLSGILIESDGQSVLGNRVGIDHNGVGSLTAKEDFGNGLGGIRVLSSDNTIGASGAGSNSVGNNTGDAGIVILSPFGSISADNVISNNRVGVTPEGEDVGMLTGIEVHEGSNTLIRNNLVAGNNRGIAVDGPGAFIQENRILGNSSGVVFRAPGHLGSLDPADANIIGNNGFGVIVRNYINGAPSALVIIRNNYIGADTNGESLGNTTGIGVIGSDNSLWVGQPDGNAGNVIVNNTASGINFREGASGAVVAGNLIGIHSNGQPMGNRSAISMGSGAGSNASNNRIGFSQSAVINPETWSPGNDPGNVIAYNEEGIQFDRADDNSIGNVIRGNQFIENDDIGYEIDLGMTSSDIGGSSDGPNTLLNYPDIDPDQTILGGTELTYTYRVRTSAFNADYPLVIDFHLTVPAGTSRTLTFIGSDEYPATSAGNYRTGALSLPQGLAVPTGAALVATATDSSGNTSQFTLDPVILEIQDSLFQDRFEN